MIERHFDIPFIADLALREKQIQQNYRPIIAVHKWFARRPGTLFRGLLLSEFAEGDMRSIFFKSHDLHGLRIADPFMGGGTPLIEANRLGCDVVGCDINPMAYWIVRQELEHLDLEAYRKAATNIQRQLEVEIGRLYRTTCRICGTDEAHVKYFIWVKTRRCDACGHQFDLIPGYLLAENVRHPQNVIICRSCGELNEVPDRRHPGICGACGTELEMKGPASRNRCPCPACGFSNPFAPENDGPPGHRLIAIEYYCPRCKSSHAGRFFKKPDAEDLAETQQAEKMLGNLSPVYIPDDEIPSGDETDRLHRWGYRRYREMFNPRQLLGLELICRAVARVEDERVRNALATNLSDLLRYQNMLCRYDTMALKSLDIFSVHGFPVGLMPCESNLLGIVNGGGVNVGSGGWLNIVEKFAKAKSYCDQPFEILHEGGRKKVIPVAGEWIGDRWEGSPHDRRIELHCGSSTELALAPASLDAVITDPPYFANVQYAELMDFCYVWLRKLISDPAFAGHSTRNEQELTGNATMDRGLEHFTEGMVEVFSRMRTALKPGSPLAFTYHHNNIEAYFPIAVALLDAGLVCSATLPCPAEMGASIHINGTGSSIVDTVFVCRTIGTVPGRLIVKNAPEIARLVREDTERLKGAGFEPTHGDIRCVAYGHLIRMAVWELRRGWRADVQTGLKLKRVGQFVSALGGWSAVEQCLHGELRNAPQMQAWVAKDATVAYGEEADAVSF
ncbi:MAG: DUF1156 domain-containing protein [Bacteroidota bacterium]